VKFVKFFLKIDIQSSGILFSFLVTRIFSYSLTNNFFKGRFFMGSEVQFGNGAGRKKSVLYAIVVAVLLAGCGGGGGGESGGKTEVGSKGGKSGNDRDMVLVKGGTFTMGCTAEQGNDCDDDEKPSHSVTLSDFYISKYEVTQKQWYEIMGSNPTKLTEGENLPVDNVSWNDVQEFIQKLNEKTGKKYRLPTEAEWEYAARGGNKSKGDKYSGGNDIDAVAWYGENSGGTTHPVGTKQANELGLYDMSGNLWEWVSDWKGNYSSFSVTDPQGPSSDSNRVFRGGGWRNVARSCRVSIRYGFTPDFRYYNLGFRLGLSP
jgi:formylglycine-generating enzyme required for sulfatase activity